ncbi:CHASE3 domain-containing protein [Vibrio sp. JC009]|uniref:CHASE3 domain-containing protein n=1 Tax=Vibrio sp. JC009 TaxID=2912314 RepID=UPI0023AF77F9|nr:CHASE3 domain-containing protein [Vibrio sp. JC009]WED24207.1 CHASE3 domain-containing protein [Vibrio sp. JC009]
MLTFLHNLRLRTRLILGFSMPFVSIFVLAFIAQFSVNSLFNLVEEQREESEVIAQVKQIKLLMSETETGMRGFLISGKESFLNRYIQGQESFDNALINLKNTYKNDKEELVQIEEIRILKDKWTREAAELQIQLRKEVAKGEKATENFVRLSKRTTGPALFAEIREILAQISAEVDAQYDRDGYELTNSVLMAMVNQETGQRGFLLTGIESELRPYYDGQEELKRNISALREHLSTTFYDTEELLNKLTKIESLSKKWVTEAADPEIAARHEMNKVTVTLADITDLIEKGHGERIMNSIRQVIDSLIESEMQQMNKEVAKTESDINDSVLTGIVITVIALVLTAVLALWIIRQVQSQVGGEPAEIAQLTLKIAEGDLSTASLKSKDKKSIYASVLSMASQLRSTISKVSEATHSQSDAAESLSVIAEQTNSNVKAQIEAADQVSSAIDEMLVVVGSVAQSAAQAADSATQAEKVVKSGNEKAESAADGVIGLSDNLIDTSGKIQDLANSANEISDILNVIKGIADQTNLLALNAAIEAARAGEHGRGFAVVADEVRALAQSTQDSTVEIENMISRVQGEAKYAVSSMEQGQEKAAAIVEQTMDVQEALGDILQMVNQISGLTEEIAGATEQQSISSKEVGVKSEEIRSQSTQTGEGAAQIAEATQDLKRLSQLLHNEVAFFRL